MRIEYPWNLIALHRAFNICLTKWSSFLDWLMFEVRLIWQTFDSFFLDVRFLVCGDFSQFQACLISLLNKYIYLSPSGIKSSVLETSNVIVSWDFFVQESASCLDSGIFSCSVYHILRKENHNLDGVWISHFTKHRFFSILFLRFLLSLSFDWEKKSVFDFRTPRSSSEILPYAS